MQIDTSTTNQQPLPKKLSDDINQKLIEALQEQNLIYMQKRQIIEEIQPRTLPNTMDDLQSQMKDDLFKAVNVFDRRLDTNLKQLNKGYGSKTIFNKYYHDLNNYQKNEFKAEFENFYTQDITNNFLGRDVNVEKMAKSNRTMEEVYLDAGKYLMKDVKDLLKFV